MPMKSKDLTTKSAIREALQTALRDNNVEAFTSSFEQMLGEIADEVRQSYEEKDDEMRIQIDTQVLTSRGVRQLTSKERTYYQRLGEAMRAPNPKEALANTDLVMEKTIVNSVFDDLRTNHPLLSRISFMAGAGLTEMITNENGYQEAVWGKLTGKIVTELLSGFDIANMTLVKLSAFLPVCKSMLDLGPEWLDRYVREVLYEALANGLTAGFLVGDGNDKPIGMNRSVGEGVTVTGGVYPVKNTIAISDLSAKTMGSLLSILAVDANGNARTVSDLILAVNPQDYFSKVMPATTMMAPDGTYRSDVLPYPCDILPEPAVPLGRAVLGLAGRYAGGVGMATDGKIEYSDEYRFLEDERVYLVKLYANGYPKDNNAFLFLDITGLEPASYKVTMVTPPTPSNDAALSDLRIGTLALSPVFSADTTAYTVSTTNAKDAIAAMPANASAQIEIKVGSKAVGNGNAFTWAEGDNTVTITVLAEDGAATKTYTVTVAKS